MAVIFVPEQRHTCSPPLGTGLPHGSVWRCGGCRSHWVLWDCGDRGRIWYGEGPISKVRRWWRGVRRVR